MYGTLPLGTLKTKLKKVDGNVISVIQEEALQEFSKSILIEKKP